MPRLDWIRACAGMTVEEEFGLAFGKSCAGSPSAIASLTRSRMTNPLKMDRAFGDGEGGFFHGFGEGRVRVTGARQVFGRA